MTSGRRLRLAGIAITLVLASAGLAGRALATDDAARAPRPVAAVHGATTSETVAASTTTAPPAAGDLPVPEDSPGDPYAPAPVVVHGTLELPSIGVAQPLHEGVTLTAIDRGPSHWPGTAMPGRLGNVVVAGHRTTHTQPFHDLDRLAPGDPLVFRMSDGSVWTYELTSTEIVGPDAMHIVDQAPEHTATLFACHPKGSATQRIVAHFRLAAGGA
ncbi:MAG: class E sortase [Acidimicrobiales bacterium]